jgi:hypothetical protein
MASHVVCSVPSCGKTAIKRGYCGSHYKRFWRYGDPLAGGTEKGAIPRWIDEHIGHQGDECLIWPFSRNANGYGILAKKMGSGIATRVICERAYGPPPTPDHEAAHTCGNGQNGCANPRHLTWKNHTENMADTLVHGTHNRGRRNGMNILNEDQVRRIREIYRTSPFTCKEIAPMFGVTAQTVSDIVARRRWAWLD